MNVRIMADSPIRFPGLFGDWAFTGSSVAFHIGGKAIYWYGIIIALGVLCLSFLEPFLQSETMAPAFDNILPALFGGLAVVYVSKNWKIALAPLIFMVLLFILVPSLANSVGVLVPVGAIIALVVSRILYKRNLL